MTRRAAVENSRLVGAVRTATTAVDRTVRASRLAGWLTREPDPDVVVIDLRETYTVGPLLAVLDRLAAATAGRWRASGTRRALTTARATLSAAAVRVLGVGLLALSAALASTGALAAGAVVALAGALALVCGGSWTAVRSSVTGRVVRALLTPPPEPGR